MSEKTKAFMDRAKEQTIGCEIEMAEITRNTAIKVVARYFGTLETVHHDGGSYDAWSCKDTQGRTWKVMRDVSISASTDLRIYGNILSLFFLFGNSEKENMHGF